MSLGIYPVLNPKVSEAKFDGLGEVLGMQIEALSELATEHRIAPLTSFADTREVPEDFDGPPEDLERVMAPWEDWFPCRDGIVAFESLARLITDSPTAAQRLESPESVVEELRAIARVLAAGERNGSRFRLEMS